MKDLSLILECPKCSVLNYLDPFTYWNFSGKVKCAGCDAIYSLTIQAGKRTAGPKEAQAPYDKLPGYAQTKDYATDYTDPAKVNVPPKARPDFVGKPIPIVRNVRGRIVSGRPLAASDLNSVGVPIFVEKQNLHYLNNK